MNNRLDTLFTGQHVTFLETVSSTNSYMSNLLSQQQMPEGSVIVARKQTEGRGQANERWVSENGKNLLVSFAFYPVLHAQNLFMLTKTFSLGVYDCIREILGTGVKIKWPNDIYIHDKKLCGMLIENSIRNPHISHTILGIGLNINQKKFPSHLPNPVSLSMIVGKDLDLDDCFCMLCNTLENRYLQMNAGHYEKINEEYNQGLYRFGEMCEYDNNRERFRARLTAVGDDGKIFLKRDNGLIEKYDFKEIKFIV